MAEAPNVRAVLVIGPVHESSPDELRALGVALQRWQAEHPWVVRLVGLDDLLAGALPRTPARELGLSYFPGHETSEPVVLVYAAGAVALDEVYRTAAAVINNQPARIGWFATPANYNGMMA